MAVKVDLGIPILDVDVIYQHGHRYYGHDGIYVPSVTSVLGTTSDSSGLEAWKARVGEEEANRISTAATDNGTRVHKMCEDYLEFGTTTKTGFGTTDIMFKHIKLRVDKYLNEWYAQEIALHSKKFMTAGRTDLLGQWDGRKSIIDYKTNNKDTQKADIYLYDYKLQCAAYHIMLREMGFVFDQGVLLIASLYGCQVVKFDIKDYVRPFLERRAAFEKIIHNQVSVI